MGFEPRQFPKKSVIEGRYARLDPLDPDQAGALFAAASAAPDSFTFLRYGPFSDVGALRRCLEDLSTRERQPFWSVTATGAAGPAGWLSLCDIYPIDASIEIGSVWFSPALRRSRAATEAIFLLASLAFDGLGYERLVWRHVASNLRSGEAAARYGFAFEGTWRKAATFKNVRHDVVWRSMLASEWPAHREALEAWLTPDNFDANGVQRRSLRTCRGALTPPAPE